MKSTSFIAIIASMCYISTDSAQNVSRDKVSRKTGSHSERVISKEDIKLSHRSVNDVFRASKEIEEEVRISPLFFHNMSGYAHKQLLSMQLPLRMYTHTQIDIISHDFIIIPPASWISL